MIYDRVHGAVRRSVSLVGSHPGFGCSIPLLSTVVDILVPRSLTIALER